jgi:hypothetical protein
VKKKFDELSKDYRLLLIKCTRYEDVLKSIAADDHMNMEPIDNDETFKWLLQWRMRTKFLAAAAIEPKQKETDSHDN